MCVYREAHAYQPSDRRHGASHGRPPAADRARRAAFPKPPKWASWPAGDDHGRIACCRSNRRSSMRYVSSYRVNGNLCHSAPALPCTLPLFSHGRTGTRTADPDRRPGTLRTWTFSGQHAVEKAQARSISRKLRRGYIPVSSSRECPAPARDETLECTPHTNSLVTSSRLPLLCLDFLNSCMLFINNYCLCFP